MARVTGVVLLLFLSLASTARAQPVDPYAQPEPQPQVAAPPPPYAQPPAPPAEQADAPQRWYGWQTMALGTGFALLGVWGSTDDDLERDPRIGVVELSLLGGMIAGPGVHFMNGERDWGKLRRSTQFVMGGAALAFLVGCAIELSEESSNDQGEPSDGSGDWDWERTGVITFAGMGVGAVVDGAVLGRTTPRPRYAMAVPPPAAPPPPPPYSIYLGPGSGGGAVARLGMSF
jgi:hypothetical protein